MSVTDSTIAKTHSKTDIPLVQRKVSFDYSQTPLHWIPDDPYSSHFISVIHTILPAGEFFFCRLYNKALPYIEDEQLREDVKGFIKQEAMHARAHSAGLAEYLEAHGLDTEAFVKKVEWIFEQPLSDTPFGRKLPKSLEKRWLVLRLGLIAAIEHFTCVLGKYALENENWDLKDADETVLDILRWHAAEEIEHRNVAFDVYKYMGGNYVGRAPQMALIFTGLMGLWTMGASHLMKQDPVIKKRKSRLISRSFWSEWSQKAKKGSLPSFSWLAVQSARYLSPNYNPATEADTQQALDYLAQSPAAQRAEAFA
ncbi:metal-dependent hydrolase [Litoribrevibacter euphylliae]|uniref:Metal-dependent hydrolase n=1 Tax=Litoribrevibacter euphylliae TaxID=1834034 RepID=A0ABV7HJX2_9GAMM